MAKLYWDHTIHLVNDLEQAIEIFGNQGLAASRGGSHKDWGTYNALSYFGLNYIEFLALEHRDVAERTEAYNVVARDPLAHLPNREIFTRVVIRTDHIEETAANAAAQGLSVSPITGGRRQNTQGQWIEWKMAFLSGDFEGLGYPFIIQWNGTDEERLQSLTESGVIKPHLIGEIVTDRAVIEVPNPQAAADHWRKVFGLLPAAWDRQGEVALAIGEHKFVFQQGERPQITEVVFRTDNAEAKGKAFALGSGMYRFE